MSIKLLQMAPLNKSVLMRTKQKVYFFAVDTMDLLLGRRDGLTPPRRIKDLVGNPKEFNKVGDEFLGYFKELGKLRPNNRVLDVGCGNGRMAIPLTRYLKTSSAYEGFDIVAEGVEWCSKNVTPKFPNFHFKLVDIYNKRYNPKGTIDALSFKFPFESKSFDFVFLTSIFTHMLPKEMQNYFSEISRVLKKDGRCLITFFLLNSESIELVDSNSSLKSGPYDFQYKFDNYRIVDRSEPESAVAYDENFVRTIYMKNNLDIEEPIRYGSWCGRKNPLSLQDIVIATKK
jgi:SAM-dependent methyltransferase